MPRAGPAILDAQAAGPAPPTAEGGGKAAGGDARGVAAERVPRSVHLRAPRPSGKYRGRLLRPCSRPAAYRPPAAAMTPRPRASATVSAARRRRGRRRLRLPSDVTAWAHSPFPARGCGGGGSAHARPFRRRVSAGRGLEGRGRAERGGAGRRRAPLRGSRCARAGAQPAGLGPTLPSAVARGSRRWALPSPHGTARRAPWVRPELLRHPGSLGTQLLGNLVASRCVAHPGDLRLSLFPGGALVKEKNKSCWLLTSRDAT